MLRGYRIARGWTQAQLAEETTKAAHRDVAGPGPLTQDPRSEWGLSVEAIQRLETGKRQPRQRTISLIATALDLTSEERASLRDAATARSALHNIPLRLKDLIGRAEDLKRLRNLLGANRLICLTGPGGIGKTQLALAVAVQLRSAGIYRDGIWLVDFGGSDRADGALTMLCTALMRFLDVPSMETMEDILGALNAHQALLILDGCDGMNREVASLVGSIVRRCAEVSILATTREPLGVPEEQVLRLAPLSVDSAVNLLLETVRAADVVVRDLDKSSSVADMCRMVDCLPAAIELAAGWLDTLSLSDLQVCLPRLLILPCAACHSGDSTMKNVIDASYRLLTSR